MTRLILIRHGETNHNINGTYCGQENPPLNKRGRAQAKKLGKKMNSVVVHKVYSSDLKRAIQTSKLVFKGRRVEKIPRLRELSFGIFGGLKYAQIMKKYPEMYSKWIKNTENYKIPGGESLKCLHKRVKAELKRIISRHRGETIAIVTHGGPIRVVLCDILKLGLGMFWDLEQKNCAVNIIHYYSKKAPVVIKVNG